MREDDTLSPIPPMDGKRCEKKVGLPKPPLFTSDYISMAEILQFSMERFGQLILALMYYTADGTIPDNLPPDINVMFAIYQRKIDAARVKYDKKCAKNAENGAKGGKAKAENAKKQTDAFNPPTLRQFHDAVKHYLETGDIDDEVTDYDIDTLFDQLKGAGWSIRGEPIQRRSDWEEAILARFGVLPKQVPRFLYYRVFEEVFSTLHAERGSDGNGQADDITSVFFDCYDGSTKTWTVGGEEFTAVAPALDKFLKQHSECSDS